MRADRGLLVIEQSFYLECKDTRLCPAPRKRRGREQSLTEHPVRRLQAARHAADAAAMPKRAKSAEQLKQSFG